MFKNLTKRLSNIIKKMSGEVRLTKDNTENMFREIRISLLEADVSLPIIKKFISNIKNKSMGKEILYSLTPGQSLVSLIQSELSHIMGAHLDKKHFQLNLLTQPPSVILIVGLQGSGKTTSIGKLSKYLQKNKKKILTVSTDIYRPAAINQLKIVTLESGSDFFPNITNNPINIVNSALKHAKIHNYDVLIIDTPGQIGINKIMINEINLIYKIAKPVETLLIVDCMLGQDALNHAKIFNNMLTLTGIILTKLDGDARGGAALSIQYIIKKPIKFIGTSEKIYGLEKFDPIRMTNRILGMGDILSLINSAKENINKISAKKIENKIKNKEKFDLNDFKTQLIQMKKMGGLNMLIEKLPYYIQQKTNKSNVNETEKKIRRIEGIINSMTLYERKKPFSIKSKRKKRIAAGSGVNVQEINQMLIQFKQMQNIIKKIKGNSIMKIIRNIKNYIS
ncbi:signal recognition particle protein [Candidatus Profftella armatura (Diaphorina cf. continua)]|uniref:signal-recognition-particle GTPase n=1 Tax=Candidatus Profftella armatura (Diaphorina cf. continua) TaxID=2661583 RepID=A0A7R6VYJ9_9PROT|nr:signal recognition particle protein [Candidatus Profftella armatura (Diaphorina cf. continua)]BCG49478.1 signal recognition particle protein [Candidatus Profftella armatura (Diaphorina cf. continua)]